MGDAPPSPGWQLGLRPVDRRAARHVPLSPRRALPPAGWQAWRRCRYGQLLGRPFGRPAFALMAAAPLGRAGGLAGRVLLPGPLNVGSGTTLGRPACKWKTARVRFGLSRPCSRAAACFAGRWSPCRRRRRLPQRRRLPGWCQCPS
eukprot:3957182-Alexandrium_andersonii.AAC.1